MNLSFRVSYRDGVMEHEPKACAAVKGTQIMVCALSLPLAIFFLFILGGECMIEELFGFG